MDRREHGGDNVEAERLYGRPREGWLDLSTGINPLPYPARLPQAAAHGPLPLRQDLEALCHAAARRYGCPDARLITPAPGTQSLIQWLPRLRPACRVGVLSPTYNEHAHCWRQAGHRVEEPHSLDGLEETADVVVVVNPNNPDGRRHDPDALLALARALAQRGGWLVVDEAFCDVTPERSLAPAAGEPGLIVLRSFGKFYGLAGLRLGFALGEGETIDTLSECLGPWAVSTPAIAVGATALGDDAWTGATRLSLEDMARRLDGILAEQGLDITGGCSLFRLASSPRSPDLFGHLARQGILVRRYSGNPDWLRFGLPGPESDWRRLETAMGSFRS